MNESVVGVITRLTLQNEGTFVYVTPFAAVKFGPGTVTEPVTVPPLKPTSRTVRFSHVPACAAPAASRASAAAVVTTGRRSVGSLMVVFGDV